MSHDLRCVLDPGQALFHEGDAASCAYIIEEGRVGVSVQRNGSRHVLAELHPGALIGELALLDGGTRTATVVALEPTVLQRIERAHIEGHLRSAEPFVRHVLQLLMGRYRDVVERLDGLAGPRQSARRPAETLDPRVRRAMRSGQDFDDALKGEQFILHYQPIMRLSDNSVAGFEALIRWLHPELGLIAPDEFIPIAERSGAILRLGHWVIRSAARALALMGRGNPAEEAAPLFMTVNVSGAQFADPDLVGVLRDALLDTGIQPGRLRLEITESSLFDRIDEAARLMDQCAALGVKLAVDDFGTGYSALSYLYRLPVSGVKLARAFITDLAQYPQSTKIVGAVSRLAKDLAMETVAEGVETAAQADAVRRLGIEYGQGFHYAAGLPLLVASRFMQRSFESAEAAPLLRHAARAPLEAG